MMKLVEIYCILYFSCIIYNYGFINSNHVVYAQYEISVIGSMNQKSKFYGTFVLELRLSVILNEKYTYGTHSVIQVY